MDNRQKKIEGMSEDELIRICSGGDTKELSKYPDWSSEIYGFGKLIREYGYYPKSLPLYISTDHGPGQHDFPNSKELQSKMPVHFYHSPRLVKIWPRYSKRPCYSLYSPYVFYRKKNVRRNKDAKGTIAFPTHSTHFIDINFDVDKYIDQLLALPEEYKPVSVCMYFLDVQKGLHKPFFKRRIPVYSAGHWFHPDFVENFYNIINRFRYATSDSCGSYLFYAVDLGLPFFILGDKPEKFNSGDVNSQLGKYTNDNYTQIKKIDTLFLQLTNKISEEQAAIVSNELGIDNGLSRAKLSLILYRTYLEKTLVRFKKRLKAFGSKIFRKIKGSIIPL